jgi:hypothetical protein
MKTIVYLDQPFVSNLWKSDQGSYRVDPIWGELHEALRQAVKKKETVICPATPFHDEEGSLDSRIAVGVHEVSAEVSWGLKFLHLTELLDNQARRALYGYLGIRLEEPQWRDAFNADPHEPTSERSTQFLGSTFLIDAFMPRPDEFSAELRAAKDTYVKRLTSSVLTSERRAFAEQLKPRNSFSQNSNGLSH